MLPVIGDEDEDKDKDEGNDKEKGQLTSRAEEDVTKRKAVDCAQSEAKASSPKDNAAHDTLTLCDGDAHADDNHVLEDDADGEGESKECESKVENDDPHLL